MKKIFIILFLFIFLACIVTFYIFNSSCKNKVISSSEGNTVTNNYSVSYNGWLHTDGCMLKNEKGEIIQLRGISSHGIEWFDSLVTYENLETLKNDWGVNIFRIAMYTDVANQGYIYNKESNFEKVSKIVDMAIDLDMYVVVDWHILSDNNPQIHKEDAKLFFNEISKKYSSNSNVIYEICNEPNGVGVDWNNDIKPYAEEIIPIIRNNSKKSLIIVGTANWCTRIADAADNPLNFENIMYACHFYSGSHGAELREKIDYCIQKNIPIIVSECGVTNAYGDGETYFDKFNEWINYLDLKNISWIYWSFSNKNESSSLLIPEYIAGDNSYSINDLLSDSGKFIRDIFRSYKK